MPIQRTHKQVIIYTEDQKFVKELAEETGLPMVQILSAAINGLRHSTTKIKTAELKKNSK